jgi:hypothetical protein
VHDEAETGCIRHIKLVCERLLGRPMTIPWYDVNRDAVRWAQYYREHRPQIDASIRPMPRAEQTEKAILASIVAKAREWSQTPLG